LNLYGMLVEVDVDGSRAILLPMLLLVPFGHSVESSM
jgi:hypothetical protein